MKVFNASLTVSSGERTELSDITRLVQAAIQRCPVSAGIALVHTLHTTCALFVNECLEELGDLLFGHPTESAQLLIEQGAAHLFEDLGREYELEGATQPEGRRQRPKRRWRC